MKICNFARIGKAILKAATGVQRNHSILTTSQIINMKKCEASGCSLCTNHFSQDETKKLETKKFCLSHCPYKCIDNKKSYINEGNSLKISKYTRLSKLQLKQFVLFHFLWIDERGFIKNVNELDLAKKLKCSVNTVRNNNIALQEYGYIAFSRSSNETVSIFLLDYTKYHLESKKGGCGYITMPKNMLNELLSIKNVNTLRLEVRQILKDDDYQVKEIETEVKLSFKEYSRLLPDYFKGKKSILNVLKPEMVSNLFQFKNDTNGFCFKLKEFFNGKKQKETLTNAYKKELEVFFIKQELVFDEKTQLDLLQMSVQYELELVKAAIVKAKTFFDKIDNIGGYIRTSILNKLSAL